MTFYKPANPGFVPNGTPRVLRLVNMPVAGAGAVRPEGSSDGSLETPGPIRPERSASPARGTVHLSALRMSSASAAPPALRSQPSEAGAGARTRGAWAEIAKENLAARAFASGVGNSSPSGLGHTDPRWLLAVKTSSLLEGGKAALLTPAKRQSIMTLARQLGLRPFEASLVVAVVQDGARAGEGTLSEGVKARLSLVGTGAAPLPPSRSERSWAGLMGVAAALGGVLTAMLIRWLEG